MTSYSVAVAVFDFLPVALSATGLAWLARAIARLRPGLWKTAAFAVALVALGGACKASWKLIVALTGVDLAWLESLLFVLMAPGFILLSACLFRARRQDAAAAAARESSTAPLLAWAALPPVLAAVAAISLPDSRLWFFWLLGVTTLANAWLLINAVILARQRSLGWHPAACFACNFLATLALSGLSRLPPGEMTAWIQEWVNFSAQAALALGAWLLLRRLTKET